MDIVAVGNQKGGVGKTTTAHTLASIAASKNLRTLMVDLDAQGSLTVVATGKLNHDVTLANVLGGATPPMGLSRVVQRVSKRLDIAPGGGALTMTEIALNTKVGRESFLKRAIAQAGDLWDLVVIDTPPTCSLMTINALVAAHTVLIPTQTQALDLAGLENFRRTVAEVQEVANPRLKIAGVVATFYDAQLIEHREALQEIRDAGLPLCQTLIGCSTKVARSARFRKSVTEYAADNMVAAAYVRLAKELNMDGGTAC